jgi:hypothetical protein
VIGVLLDDRSLSPPFAGLQSPSGLVGSASTNHARQAAHPRSSSCQAIESAKARLRRLVAAGFALSRNDRKIVRLGQLLTTLQSPGDVGLFRLDEDHDIESTEPEKPPRRAQGQRLMFD